MDAKELASKIVNALLKDLDGRSGFDLCSVDEETQNEMRATWEGIVVEKIMVMTIDDEWDAWEARGRTFPEESEEK